MKRVKFLHDTVWVAAPGGSRKILKGAIEEVPEGDTLNAWIAAGVVDLA